MRHRWILALFLTTVASVVLAFVLPVPESSAGSLDRDSHAHGRYGVVEPVDMSVPFGAEPRGKGVSPPAVSPGLIAVGRAFQATCGKLQESGRR
jgi:hypothetical protein